MLNKRKVQENSESYKIWIIVSTPCKSKFNYINGDKAVSRNLSKSFSNEWLSALKSLLCLDFVSTLFFISGS